jgi:hypothetical protein
VIQNYPLAIPDLDWGWMIGGIIAMVLAFGIAYWCRTAGEPKPAPTPAVPEAA